MLAVAVAGLVAGIIIGAGLYLWRQERAAKRELDQAIAELGKWARYNIYLFDDILRRR